MFSFSPSLGPKSLLVGMGASGLLLVIPHQVLGQAPDPPAEERVCTAVMNTRPGLRITSSLLHSGQGEFGAGIGLNGGECRASHDDREERPRSRVAAVTWDLTAPMGFSEPLPIVSQVEATVGLQMGLARREESDDHLGYLGASLKGQLQSSSDFQNYVLALGGEVQWTDPARPFLPSVAMFFGTSQVIRSGGVAATMDPPEEELRPYLHDTSRLSLRGWWAVPLPAGFSVEAEGAFHRGFGRPVTLGFSQLASPNSEELRAGLVWRRQIEEASAAGTRIEAISLNHHRGRPPAAPSAGELWTLRVSVGW